MHLMRCGSSDITHQIWHGHRTILSGTGHEITLCCANLHHSKINLRVEQGVIFWSISLEIPDWSWEPVSSEHRPKDTGEEKLAAGDWCHLLTETAHHNRPGIWENRQQHNTSWSTHGITMGWTCNHKPKIPSSTETRSIIPGTETDLLISSGLYIVHIGHILLNLYSV